MFKKLLLLFILISPILFITCIGVPILNQKEFNLKQKVNPKISISQRCYPVENFSKFVSCYQSNPRLNGVSLAKNVSTKIYSHSPFFLLLFLLAIITNLVVVIYLIIRREER